jgi:L-threonine kinase
MGELVQGLREGKEVLISLPIDRYSEMEVIWQDEERKTHENNLWKSEKALRWLLRSGDGAFSGADYFSPSTRIPPGKGLASSTADIAALLGALARFLGRSIREEEIARIALQVEPTDSVFFSELSIFDHLEGQVKLPLPLPRYLGVVVIELPGERETLAIDREKLRENWEKHRREIEEAFRLVERGLEEGDLSLVGRGATLSGQIMQEVEKEDLWDKMISISLEIGAAGVNRAHTGRALGILFDRRVYPLGEMLSRVREALKKEEVKIEVNTVISGGVRV